MARTSARERVLIVGVAPKGVPRSVGEDQLDELERLVDTAGGDVVGRFVKERAAARTRRPTSARAPSSRSAAAARSERAGLVVFDDELSAGQVRNLEKAWGENVRVLDRPGLILDVFALHARSREARTQVELAQLQYLLPRLTGAYGHLSRLGGGIGGRGAGEQKLELDRRKIRDRIARLRRDLGRIEVARLVRRRGRRRHAQVAIAGYTNAGKTTLFNRLTRDAAFAADRLFATLDARAARAASAKLSNVIFVDTVGFVRKLPPSLVASFRSTLSEIREADLVLHVLDASSPRRDEEERVAAETFEELGVPRERILAVLNKADAAGRVGGAGVAVSALHGTGDRPARAGDRAAALSGAGAVPRAHPLRERPGHRGRARRLPCRRRGGPRRLALDAARRRPAQPAAAREVRRVGAGLSSPGRPKGRPYRTRTRHRTDSVGAGLAPALLSRSPNSSCSTRTLGSGRGACTCAPRARRRSSGTCATARRPDDGGAASGSSAEGRGGSSMRTIVLRRGRRRRRHRSRGRGVEPENHAGGSPERFDGRRVGRRRRGRRGRLLGGVVSFGRGASAAGRCQGEGGEERRDGVDFDSR